MELTEQTLKAIDALFEFEDRDVVKDLLIHDCSNNVAGCSTWQQEQLERLWISALKISCGDIEQLHSAIVLAQTDYRDLFMAAGFGRDALAHKRWRP